MRFRYIVHPDDLSRATERRDLGVTFDSKLYFHEHVQSTASHTMKILGIICRITKAFSCPDMFLTLLSSLPRSRLEYASVVWNDRSKSGGDCVQRKMACGLFYRYIFGSNYCYTAVANAFYLDSITAGLSRTWCFFLSVYRWSK